MSGNGSGSADGRAYSTAADREGGARRRIGTLPESDTSAFSDASGDVNVGPAAASGAADCEAATATPATTAEMPEMSETALGLRWRPCTLPTAGSGSLVGLSFKGRLTGTLHGGAVAFSGGLHRGAGAKDDECRLYGILLPQ